MGTCLYFHLQDTSKAQACNDFFTAQLEQASTDPARDWRNHVPSVWTPEDIQFEIARYGGCAFKLGHGDFKLSGWIGDEQDEQYLDYVITTILQARTQFGLVVEHLPTNANDYLTQQQCDALEPPEEREFQNQLMRKDDAAWGLARRDGLACVQAERSGGGLLLPRAGGGWLSCLFAKVDGPRLCQYYYDKRGRGAFTHDHKKFGKREVRSAVFELKDGCQVLLIPLLALNREGTDKLISAFSEVPFSCYSSAPLRSLLAGAYKLWPAQFSVVNQQLRDLGNLFGESVQAFLHNRAATSSVWLNFNTCEHTTWAQTWVPSTDTWARDKDYDNRNNPTCTVSFLSEPNAAVHKAPREYLNCQALAAMLWKLDKTKNK